MSLYARLILTHLPAWICGLALVQLAWPRRGLADAWLKLPLGGGLGWGISSSLFFLWSLGFSPFQKGFGALEWGLALGLAAAAVFRERKPREHLPARSSWTGGLAALAVFAALAALLWVRADAEPSGNFDAYAIWNLRARFIFLSTPATWKAAFSPLLDWSAHADYPLLWPLTLLRSFLTLGRMPPQAAIFQTVLFGVLAGGVFAAGLWKLRGAWQAAAGGLALLGMPWMINYNAFQQSDVPLVLYYLAGIVLLALGLKERGRGYYFLAGLAAACAAWTKNDGLVFLFGSGLWVLCLAVRTRRAGELAAFGLGALLPLAALFAFKIALAPPGDLIAGQSLAQILAKLADPSRYATIALAILRMLPQLGGTGWQALAAGAAYFLLAGLSPRRGGARLFAVLGLALLGYCAVYLITPHPLDWHLKYSLDRILFHLLIPALFLIFVQVRSPEELWARLRGPRAALVGGEEG